MHHACQIRIPIVVKKLLNLPEIDLTLYVDYGDTPLFDTMYASEHIFDNFNTTGITNIVHHLDIKRNKNE
jgi:hypothetical protein